MVTRAIETMFVAGPNAGKFNGELLRAPRQTESRRWVTGMPDEATRRKNITNQTMAHRELGLEYMDLRLAEDSDGKVKNVVAIDDRAFGEVERAVNRAGLVVSCFESSIANWKRSLTEPLEADIVELRRAIPRMKALGTEWIRVMSWLMPPGMAQSQAEPLVFDRMQRLVEIAEQGEITLLQENCTGWGGISSENAIRLVEKMASPRFHLIFDTGNPIPHNQDPVKFLMETMKYTRFVHIKDCFPTIYKPDTEIYTRAGMGSARIREILFQLMLRGYTGGFSLEPHIADKIHLGIVAKSETEAYDSYVGYGRAFLALLAEVEKDYEGFLKSQEK